MIQLYKDGRFPFDRLIQTFALEQVNEAEEASLHSSVIKPVLLPTPT
jgi:aryl-alcohol dehydrogenase